MKAALVFMAAVLLGAVTLYSQPLNCHSIGRVILDGVPYEGVWWAERDGGTNRCVVRILQKK